MERRRRPNDYRYEIVDDPDNEKYPKHPTKLSTQPIWTDRKTFGLPVFHLYGFVFGFCIVYIGAGLIGLLTGITIPHMDYLTIIGMLCGYLIARFVIEPKFFIIPFEKGSPEQQAEAVAKMEEYLGAQAEIEEYRREKAAAEANNFDRSVYEDDEEADEPEEETEED